MCFVGFHEGSSRDRKIKARLTASVFANPPLALNGQLQEICGEKLPADTTCAIGQDSYMKLWPGPRYFTTSIAVTFIDTYCIPL